MWKSNFCFLFFLTASCLFKTTFAEESQTVIGQIKPSVSLDFFAQAKKNTNWKTAFITGNELQIVFMSVSKQTNPSNEIGLEVHPFDQVIMVVEGEGSAILNGEITAIKNGDAIFVPRLIPHNISNKNENIPLKIISFYSDTDIPANAVYKTKADAEKE